MQLASFPLHLEYSSITATCVPQENSRIMLMEGQVLACLPGARRRLYDSCKFICLAIIVVVTQKAYSRMRTGVTREVCRRITVRRPCGRVLIGATFH